MALSIVAQTFKVSSPAPGVKRSTTCRYDMFAGTAEALIADGIITPQQLLPQAGRKPGLTAFLPSGEPCPPNVIAWRRPGFKFVRMQPDGSYLVEVAVSKDVYLARRAAEAAAEHEAEQERTDKEIEEHGHKYRNWKLTRSFDRWCETWEGTKEQLQAAGLGVGLRFPGEPGAPEAIRCSCPLGFEFNISFPGYERAKQAAGIYTARSWYTPYQRRPKKHEAFAPGVRREVWSPGDHGIRTDVFDGTADALLKAGLIPDVRYFPGMPGTNKTQVSYRKNWERASTANGQDWGVTIRRCGNSGRFVVEVAVEDAELERRQALAEAHDAAEAAEQSRLAVERKQLREAATPEKSVTEFRDARARVADVALNFLWAEVFGRSEGSLRFALPEGCDLWDEVAEAFQTIRRAVAQAEVVRDEKTAATIANRLRLAAARNDAGLQALLRKASQSRGHSSEPDEPQE